MNTRLLLLADSRLPAGGHAHSGGLEPAVNAGAIATVPDLADFLAGRLHTTGLVTAALAAAACRHAAHLEAQAHQPPRLVTADAHPEDERDPETGLPNLMNELGLGTARLPVQHPLTGNERDAETGLPNLMNELGLGTAVECPLVRDELGLGTADTNASVRHPRAGDERDAKTGSPSHRTDGLHLWDSAGGGVAGWDELDAEADARTPSPAQRQASRAQGKALLRAARATWPSAVLDGLTARHHAIVLGVAAFAAGGTPEEAAAIAAYGSVTGPASAAVRLLGLDPLLVHRALGDLAPQVDAVAVEACDFKDWADIPAASAPILDIFAELHLQSDLRLFES